MEPMTMGSPMAMGSPTSPGSGGLNQSTFLPSYLMGEPSPMVQTVSYVNVYACITVLWLSGTQVPSTDVSAQSQNKCNEINRPRTPCNKYQFYYKGV